MTPCDFAFLHVFDLIGHFDTPLRLCRSENLTHSQSKEMATSGRSIAYFVCFLCFSLSHSWVDPCTEIDGMFSDTARCDINTHRVHIYSYDLLRTVFKDTWRKFYPGPFLDTRWTRKTPTKGLKPRNIMKYRWRLGNAISLGSLFSVMSCQLTVMASGCQATTEEEIGELRAFTTTESWNVPQQLHLPLVILVMQSLWADFRNLCCEMLWAMESCCS